jgi:hypothetical protein
LERDRQVAQLLDNDRRVRIGHTPLRKVLALEPADAHLIDHARHSKDEVALIANSACAGYIDVELGDTGERRFGLFGVRVARDFL